MKLLKYAVVKQSKALSDVFVIVFFSKLTTLFANNKCYNLNADYGWIKMLMQTFAEVPIVTG